MSEKNINILLIDDDKNFRKILVIRLKSKYKYCSITEAEDLESARLILSKEEFNLVILDQHLPDGTGSEFLTEPFLMNTPVLSMSSDEAPEIPGTTMLKGARFFLSKKNVSEAFFLPLTESLIERSRIEKEIETAKKSQTVLETVKTLLGTLRHEINNPLGAVFGAMYVLKSTDGNNISEENKKALQLIHESSLRIKNVLEALSQATELELVDKATEKLFLIPGDSKWDKK